MGRAFAPLDVLSLAKVALMSPAHFSRQFRATFGETPHRYLQRRRIDCALRDPFGNHIRITQQGG